METIKLKSHLPSTIYHLPLITIVGPTASGKTTLAIDLAKRCNGEIICADSRSIYKGANIGTAKPTTDEQAIIPHWGLDLVNPGEYFSVADFKAYADKKITEIRARNHVPFLVGGTGLYIDAVIFDYQFGPPADAEFRSSLQSMSLDELYVYCKKHNVKLPENFKNKRYVIRAIENKDENLKKRSVPLDRTIVVGISTDKSILRARIVQRSEQLFEDGVVNEAKMLGDTYGWDSEAMKSNIYPLIHLFLQGQMSMDEVETKFVTLDWRLAKRQLTWLHRNKFIHWLSLDDAKNYLADKLAIRR